MDRHLGHTFVILNNHRHSVFKDMVYEIKPAMGLFCVSQVYRSMKNVKSLPVNNRERSPL